jgi:hypothetical protein
MRKPWRDFALRINIVLFLAYISIFGISRIYIHNAIVSEVLYIILFLVGILVAPIVSEILGMRYILTRLFISSVLLIIMHTSASIWDPAFSWYNPLGNYLGAFETKHIAGATFLSLIPFLVLYYLHNKKIFSLTILSAHIFFLLITFQRTSILSLGVFLTFVFFLTRKFRLIFIVICITGIMLFVLPQENIQNFIGRKLIEEYEAFRSGNLEAIGAGRLGIIILALDWFWTHFTWYQQLIGLGTAHSYKLHSLVLGYVSYAHVQFVQLLIDYGVIGVILIAIIFSRVYYFRSALVKQEKTWFNIIAMAALVMIISQLFYGMPLQLGGTSALFAFWFLSSDRSKVYTSLLGKTPARQYAQQPFGTNAG